MPADSSVPRAGWMDGWATRRSTTALHASTVAGGVPRAARLVKKNKKNACHLFAVAVPTAGGVVYFSGALRTYSHSLCFFLKLHSLCFDGKVLKLSSLLTFI